MAKSNIPISLVLTETEQAKVSSYSAALGKTSDEFSNELIKAVTNTDPSFYHAILAAVQNINNPSNLEKIKDFYSDEALKNTQPVVTSVSTPTIHQKGQTRWNLRKAII